MQNDKTHSQIAPTYLRLYDHLHLLLICDVNTRERDRALVNFVLVIYLGLVVEKRNATAGCYNAQ